MKDKVFIDTNIFVYAALLNESEKIKHETAINLVQKDLNIIISTQILNEFYNVLLKHKIQDSQIVEYSNEIIRNVTVDSQNIETLKTAWRIKAKYTFSLWDSLVIASALQNNCQILYSEDMQHNQLIENSLKIVNPFAK